MVLVTIETRKFKHFDSNKFLRDLNQMPWGNVDLYSDANDMWREWKKCFSPVSTKTTKMEKRSVKGKRRCPWITGDVLCKTRRRDFLKKKAISCNDLATWDQYKRARNRANNAIKLAKKLHVSDNLEANKGNLRKTR